MRFTLGIGSYFGIPVRVHFTFPLILIAFGLEAGINGTWRDAVGAVLLILAVFVCVVLHEFGHSLQVKRYGITVRDIVLLPIGGMARAERIPDKPWQEIVVAISGPLVNFALAFIFFALIVVLDRPLTFASDFLNNMLAINIVLGTFNLIPAFPMDGGRILRGLLAFKLPYLRATRYAKNVGQIIALAFVVIGFVYSTFIMLPIIAVFIFFGAISEEHVIRVKYLLQGKRLMDFVPQSVPMFHITDTVADAVKAVTPGSPVAFPVTDERRALFGAVLVSDLLSEMRAQRGSTQLGQLLRRGFPVMTADTAAVQAYYFLKAEKKRYAGIVAADRYVGLIYFDDLLNDTRPGRENDTIPVDAS